jgi:hypothetical protein
LATLLLEGISSSDSDRESGGGGGREKENATRFPFAFADRVVQAFGQEVAVYMGGPNGQNEPALILHGIPNLKGAQELAPGTGIYQGGWEAAVEGVLQGMYQPLEFRFFIGRQIYDVKENPKRGTLVSKIEQGSYQPVACARSLALKQCLGLPKPLWHEGTIYMCIRGGGGDGCVAEKKMKLVGWLGSVLD